MRSNVWCAWWRKQFDTDEYIYHYTSFETALIILYSDQFRLSPLSGTNDTTEQKLRINYDFTIDPEKKNDILAFESYWSRWSANSKLLCFSRDRKKDGNTAIFSDVFDVTGRGFALPRMWAQYARNNSGVCFILQKEKFIGKIHDFYPEAICENVSYFDWSSSFDISDELFTRLLKIIRHNPKSTYAPTFLKDNLDFTRYSYFCKLKDWENENEFRILIPSTENEYLYVEGISDCLAGVVLGESMDQSLVKAMKTALPEKTQVRRIVFEMRRCKVERIDTNI